MAAAHLWPERIVVYGAGAIGSLYAAKLAARHPVLAIGRADHAAAIAERGLHVVGCEEMTVPLESATYLTEIAPRTLVLLTTKVTDNEGAARALAAVVRDDTVILCVQNGLHGEEIVKAGTGNRCLVLRAITQFGAILREPGVLDYRAAGYTLIEHSQASEAIAACLTAAGLSGRISEDISLEVWRKLIYNCVINPITSIVGSDVGGIAEARLDPLKQLVIDECVAVAATEGVAFGIDFLENISAVFGSSRNVASMRQDLLKGRPTEIDHMNGAVVRLGEQRGIDCPVNRALVAIVKALERGTIRP